MVGMVEIMNTIKSNLASAKTKRDVHRIVRAEMVHLCEAEKNDEINFAQYCNSCRFLFDKAAEVEAAL